MVINGQALLADPPIVEMIREKRIEHGVSWGLSEVGYDIRVRQEILFSGRNFYYVNGVSLMGAGSAQIRDGSGVAIEDGNFIIASSIEQFDMPTNMVGIVHDKSTWARHGLSVFNTVIEPGWKGYLTLELRYNGMKPLCIPAGSGIAQVIFHRISCPVSYVGRYQNQGQDPVPPIMLPTLT